MHIAVHLALMRFTGNAFPRPQGLQRWELLVALLSLAIVVGPRPAIPEKEPLINQDRARARSWGAALVSWREIISLGSAPAAITKYHRLGSLNTKMHFLTVLEGRSPRSRCQKFWFLVRAVFLACRWPPSSCGTQRKGDRTLMSLPLLIRTSVPWD